MRRSLVAMAVVALAGLVLPAAPASAMMLTPTDPNRACGWPIAYPGSANYAYPDTNAAYFVQAAIMDPGDRIVISGKDPKARYWSMQTYRFSDSTLLDSVNDETVKRRGKGSKARWTITVVAPGQDRGKDPNVLSAAEWTGVDLSNLTVVIMRVYVSGTSNLSGGPMPTVTLQSGTGKAATRTKLKTCRPDQVGPPENRPVLEPVPDVPSRFVRGGAERFYPSADTAYLAAQQAYDEDAVLVVTGKAPRIRKDVRYWSLCQNINEGDLPVVNCLRDDEISTDAQGYYRIAVVPNEQISPAERAAYPDVDFLDWGAAGDSGYDDAFLLFRNVLPNKKFRGAVTRVPVAKFADDHIGEYAPVLTMIPRAEFDAEFRTGS